MLIVRRCCDISLRGRGIRIVNGCFILQQWLGFGHVPAMEHNGRERDRTMGGQGKRSSESRDGGRENLSLQKNKSLHNRWIHIIGVSLSKLHMCVLSGTTYITRKSEAEQYSTPHTVEYGKLWKIVCSLHKEIHRVILRCYK